ncbi:MAG: bifunctional ADP-dependent NAD(P)H-hydrate dehydratase/NAD(P)H-hydrate epimerase, partial [Paramuribaculum sp.]|nr:bifunctional ADP-dependent NAD(P)H-hydrate dehydratase/NAD(P)H-hydrate epimerase [Paramuribaculum sp.]
MRIFNTEDIRAIDRRTIETDGISSIELIERVAQGVASEIAARWNPNRPVIVFAGPGNNGADALAVSRILYSQGYRPSVYLLN